MQVITCINHDLIINAFSALLAWHFAKLYTRMTLITSIKRVPNIRDNGYLGFSEHGPMISMFWSFRYLHILVPFYSLKKDVTLQLGMQHISPSISYNVRSSTRTASYLMDVVCAIDGVWWILMGFYGILWLNFVSLKTGFH